MPRKIRYLVVGIAGLFALLIGAVVFVSGIEWGLLFALVGCSTAVTGLVFYGRSNP